MVVSSVRQNSIIIYSRYGCSSSALGIPSSPPRPSALTAHLCGPSLLNNMSRTLYQRDTIAREDTATCGDGTSSEDLPLRIASIFVILVGASFGSLFPVLSRRTKYLRSRIPKGMFDTAKYFGSGVIVSHPQLLITFLSHTDRRSPLRLSIS